MLCGHVEIPEKAIILFLCAASTQRGGLILTKNKGEGIIPHHIIETHNLLPFS